MKNFRDYFEEYRAQSSPLQAFEQAVAASIDATINLAQFLQDAYSVIDPKDRAAIAPESAAIISRAQNGIQATLNPDAFKHYLLAQVVHLIETFSIIKVTALEKQALLIDDPSFSTMVLRALADYTSNHLFTHSPENLAKFSQTLEGSDFQESLALQETFTYEMTGHLARNLIHKEGEELGQTLAETMDKGGTWLEWKAKLATLPDEMLSGVDPLAVAKGFVGAKIQTDEIIPSAKTVLIPLAEITRNVSMYQLDLLTPLNRTLYRDRNLIAKVLEALGSTEYTPSDDVLATISLGLLDKDFGNVRDPILIYTELFSRFSPSPSLISWCQNLQGNDHDIALGLALAGKPPIKTLPYVDIETVKAYRAICLTMGNTLSAILESVPDISTTTLAEEWVRSRALYNPGGLTFLSAQDIASTLGTISVEDVATLIAEQCLKRISLPVSASVLSELTRYFATQTPLDITGKIYLLVARYSDYENFLSSIKGSIFPETVALKEALSYIFTGHIANARDMTPGRGELIGQTIANTLTSLNSDYILAKVTSSSDWLFLDPSEVARGFTQERLIFNSSSSKLEINCNLTRLIAMEQLKHQNTLRPIDADRFFAQQIAKSLSSGKNLLEVNTLAREALQWIIDPSTLVAELANQFSYKQLSNQDKDVLFHGFSEQDLTLGLANSGQVARRHTNALLIDQALQQLPNNDLQDAMEIAIKLVGNTSSAASDFAKSWVDFVSTYYPADLSLIHTGTLAKEIGARFHVQDPLTLSGVIHDQIEAMTIQAVLNLPKNLVQPPQASSSGLTITEGQRPSSPLFSDSDESDSSESDSGESDSGESDIEPYSPSQDDGDDNGDFTTQQEEYR